MKEQLNKKHIWKRKRTSERKKTKTLQRKNKSKEDEIISSIGISLGNWSKWVKRMSMCVVFFCLLVVCFFWFRFYFDEHFSERMIHSFISSSFLTTWYYKARDFGHPKTFYNLKYTQMKTKKQHTYNSKYMRIHDSIITLPHARQTYTGQYAVHPLNNMNLRVQTIVWVCVCVWFFSLFSDV